MSDVIKKEKKEKKQKKEAKEAPVAAASAAMAKQDDGLHIKSEAVTKAIDTKDWPLLLKVRRGQRAAGVLGRTGVYRIVAQRRRDCGPPLLTVCRRCVLSFALIAPELQRPGRAHWPLHAHPCRMLAAQPPASGVPAVRSSSSSGRRRLAERLRSCSRWRCSRCKDACACALQSRPVDASC